MVTGSKFGDCNILCLFEKGEREVCGKEMILVLALSNQPS